MEKTQTVKIDFYIILSVLSSFFVGYLCNLKTTETVYYYIGVVFWFVFTFICLYEGSKNT